MALISFRFVIGLVVLAVVSSSAGTGSTRARASTASIQESSDGARRIKPEEARELLGKDKAVLVDVRGEAAYKAGHVKGALNIPFSDIRARARELPHDKMIITYCS